MNAEDESTYRSLRPLERADYFKQLLTREGITASELARRLNKSLSYISNSLRLLKLPPLIKDGLNTGSIAEGHARALLSIHDEQLVLDLYRKVLVEQISVRAIEVLVRSSLIGEQEE